MQIESASMRLRGDAVELDSGGDSIYIVHLHIRIMLVLQMQHFVEDGSHLQAPYTDQWFPSPSLYLSHTAPRRPNHGVGVDCTGSKLLVRHRGAFGHDPLFLNYGTPMVSAMYVSMPISTKPLLVAGRVVVTASLSSGTPFCHLIIRGCIVRLPNILADGRPRHWERQCLVVVMWSSQYRGQSEIHRFWAIRFYLAAASVLGIFEKLQYNLMVCVITT